MYSPITKEGLEAHRKMLLDQKIEIERQIQAVETLIATFGGKIAKKHKTLGEIALNEKKPSKQRQVIDAVIEFRNHMGRKISTKQILEYFMMKGIFINEWEDKSTMLGTFLNAEAHKKNGRLSRVLGERGWWDLREEKRKPINIKMKSPTRDEIDDYLYQKAREEEEEEN